jgi:UDP-GlcNAc:undecaprenyl-phosphate GlcNAc-1-phosphate transferase
MESLTLKASLITIAASLVLTVLVRTLARRWGILDRPDGKRKLHGGPIPRWGGVAVYCAAVIGLLVIRFGSDGANAELTELSNTWIIAAGFVCFLGSVDDRFNLPARVKLILQIVAVLPVVLGGYYIDRFIVFGYPVTLSWFGIPLTVLWLVGCINALNLIDGMDGLASIVGIATAVMMGIIAANENHGHVAVMAAIMAASLLGFLIYNLPPASVFLGDSGSMVIGLSLGLLGIQGSLKTSATLAITAPAVVMTLPMFDIIAAVVRRKLTGRRFDSPDRLHIHHRLLDRGWTPWQVLCLIGAICLTTGGAATAATILRRDMLAWVAALCLIVLLIRLRLFGYEEFALIKNAVADVFSRWMQPLFRRSSAARNHVWKISFPTAPDSELKIPVADLWERLLRDAQSRNIERVEFRSLREDTPRSIQWFASASPESDPCCWSLSVSLPDADGELCELCISSSAPMTEESDFVHLTASLKTFAAQFASHADELLEQPVYVEEAAVLELSSDDRRKAA